jgi:hypothetical protein
VLFELLWNLYIRGEILHGNDEIIFGCLIEGVSLRPIIVFVLPVVILLNEFTHLVLYIEASR